MLRPTVLALCTALSAPAVQAHPHIFIDTGIEVIFDDEARATAVRISWTYDDFYSLLMIEDRELDADYDGKLTPEEEAALSGFDMNWDADYNGDLHVLAGDFQVPLSRPSDWTASYTDGRITSTHLRTFTEPLAPGAPIVIQVYDPGYYTAYYIAGQPVLTGAGDRCSVQVFEPDREAADARLMAAIEEMGASGDLEMDFPAIGAAYSEEARITCTTG
jgi:polyphosphate kinase